MYYLLLPWRWLVAFWRWEWTPRLLLAVAVLSLNGAIYVAAYAVGGHNALWYFGAFLSWGSYIEANNCRYFVPSHGSYLRVFRRAYWDEVDESQFTCFYRVTHRYWLGSILTVDDAIEVPNADVLATTKPLKHDSAYYDDRRPTYVLHYRGENYVATWN